MLCSLTEQAPPAAPAPTQPVDLDELVGGDVAAVPAVAPTGGDAASSDAFIGEYIPTPQVQGAQRGLR
jgi:hypothetical protein